MVEIETNVSSQTPSRGFMENTGEGRRFCRRGFLPLDIEAKKIRVWSGEKLSGNLKDWE
jgi:hypothetical protein